MITDGLLEGDITLGCVKYSPQLQNNLVVQVADNRLLNPDQRLYFIMLWSRIELIRAHQF